MTINIGVVTNDALVLGCDSVASVTMPVLDPFSMKTEKSDGGRFSVEFGFGDLRPIVTEVWGGVTKMFPLSDDPPVAATTAGLAKLNNRTMSSLAEEFKEKEKTRSRVNVEAIAKDFFRFVRKQFETHYEGYPAPEEVWEGPQFLVGGFGRDDPHPSLYRVSVTKKSAQESVREEFPKGESGVSWAGQADSVERLIRGYDSLLRRSVLKGVEDALRQQHEKMSKAMARNLQELAEVLGGDVPEDLEFRIPKRQKVSLPWDYGRIEIDYSNLPLQSAVDLTAFLVNMQSGKSKFARGVGTVGGRTHVGVVTRGRPLMMLNEPELAHNNVGFVGDL